MELLIFDIKIPNPELLSKYKDIKKKTKINATNLNGGMSASKIRLSILLVVLKTKYFTLLTSIFAIIPLINKATIKAKNINKNSIKDIPIISLLII